MELIIVKKDHFFMKIHPGLIIHKELPSVDTVLIFIHSRPFGEDKREVKLFGTGSYLQREIEMYVLLSVR